MIDSNTTATLNPDRPDLHGSRFIMADRMGLTVSGDIPEGTRIDFYTLSGRHVKTAIASKAGDRISLDGLTGLFLAKFRPGAG